MHTRLGQLRAIILAACTYFGCACINDAVAHATHHHPHLVYRTLSKTAQSGHKIHRAQTGQASVYSSKFTGRKMASGGRFSPTSDSAASSTLPLGTVALVTNLRNGRTTTVKIRDHSRLHAGRIVDLSPQSAKKLGFPRYAVGHVAVAPLSTPKSTAAHQSVAAR